MADVKWIKMSTELFDNRKIKQIETLPDGDSIIVIWMKLLCLAGNINDSGFIYFTKEIPYTDQMLATEFNRPMPVVKLAFDTFQQFGMIEILDDVMHISNWERYQNVEGMDKIREQTRERVARHREAKKICNVTGNVTVTQCNATDKNKKENKKEIYYPTDPDLNQAFADYVDYRKKIKKTMTDKAITLAIGNLTKLSGGDRETAIKIIEQTIMNGWIGLFELKSQAGQKKVSTKFSNFHERDEDWDDIARGLIQ